MKTLGSIALLSLLLGGCNSPNAASPVAKPDKMEKNADNTGVNVRDRDSNAKTPIDQNENQADIDVTAQIRKQVIDKKFSTSGKNVKIITQNGQVTLRGPVDSQDEKEQIDAIAHSVAGDGKVDSQLEVKR